MFSYIWRQLLQRKVRTGLSMLGVSVSVAGIVALISVSEGMLESLDEYMVQSGADLLVFSRDAGGLEYSNVPGEAVEVIRKLDGVEDVGRANFTFQMGPKLAAKHRAFPVLPCFGRFWDERLAQRYRRMLTAGQMPTERHHILAGHQIAEKIGFAVGDRFPLFQRQVLGIEEYELVGIFDSDINWEDAGVVVHGDVIRAQQGRESYNILFLYCAEGRADALAETIEKKYQGLVALPPAQFTRRFSDQMEVMEDFVAIITIIAMVVGILGVLNTMMMSVSERTREIGMLRALGWSRGLVIKAILAEGVLLSVVGGAVGLLLGVAGTELLVRYAPGGFLVGSYSAPTFLKGGTVALVVGVLAAIYPALRAANLRPVEALRYE